MTDHIFTPCGQKVQISPEDYEEVSKYTWRLRSGYANSEIGSLHSLILRADHATDVIDHINHDKLDNRRENLRYVSRSLNSHNKKVKIRSNTPYRGITQTKGDKWVAKFRDKNLGTYHTDVDAAIAWNKAVREAYGDAALENNIPDTEVKRTRTVTRTPSRGDIKRTTSQRYEARLGYENKRYYIGTFDKTENAQNAINNKYNELVDSKTKPIICRNHDNICILTTKKGDEILVDEDVALRFHDSAIHVDSTGYPKVKGERLHSILSKAPKGQVVDHIDRNKLNAQRKNLRIVSYSDNQRNIEHKNGGYRGIRERKISDKITVWDTGFYKEKNYYSFCSLADEQSAALAYNILSQLVFETPIWLNQITTNTVKVRSPNGTITDHTEAEFKILLQNCIHLPKAVRSTKVETSYHGIYHNNGYWVAKIMHNKVLHVIGRFPDSINAAKAHDIVNFYLRGKTAILNNIPESNIRFNLEGKIWEMSEEDYKTHIIAKLCI